MSLEQIIVDRLCESREQVGKMNALIADLREQEHTFQAEIHTARQQRDEIIKQRDAISRERDRLAALVDKARKGDKPITDLFLAADEVRKACDGPRSELRAAISKLGSAMVVAEPFTDLIPF
jgi:ABC-type transporter Mla subunit MlaD